MTDKPKNIEDSEHMPPPAPATVPPPPAESTVMTTPDHSYIVVAMAGEPKVKVWLEKNDEASILAFIQEAAQRLAATDAHWGYVQAGPNDRKAVVLPSNQRVAADAVMYDTTRECVQLLRNALESGKDAQVGWLLLPMPKVQAKQWYPTKGEL